MWRRSELDRAFDAIGSEAALHAALPNKPWGSVAMRGEADPGTRWYLPGAVRSVAWAALAAAAIHSHGPWGLVALLALMPRTRPFAWSRLDSA